MSVPVLVKGVWRESWSVHVKVDEVYRDTDVFNNVNGVWRASHKHLLTADDITGFRMIYKLNRSTDQSHPLFKHLKFNPNIPLETYISAPSLQTIDHSIKGVTLRYSARNDQEYREHEEGILMYNGILYAIMTNDQAIAVSFATDTKVNNDDNRIPGSFVNGQEGWMTNRMMGLSLVVMGYTQAADLDGYVSGWNSFFDDNQNVSIDPPIQHWSPNRCILPIDAREPSFHEYAQIGIARNITKPENNMVGSSGTLSQTVTAIILDGIKKPFSMELYD